MRTTRMSISKYLVIAGVLGLLAGCSGGGSSKDTGEGWGSFKCTAINQSGNASIGWAVNQSRARNIALDKCRAQSANPDACRISQCVSE